MKKEVTINKIRTDKYLHEIIEMHKSIYLNNNLYNKMIYFDDNFITFFKNVLDKKDHFVYGIFQDDFILGFIHFRIIEHSAFLNNIYISEKLRGSKVASKGILFALNQMIFEYSELKYVELDVLESNKFVREWYNRLGLIEQTKTKWFLVDNLGVDHNENSDLTFIKKKDKNGFESIYMNSFKVATIINNNHIFVHKKIALFYNSCMPFLIKYPNGEFDNTFNIDKASLLEISIRLKGPFEDVINNLSKRI